MRKLLFLLLGCAASAAAQEQGKTIEEIVARVNNEIITRSEYDKARTSAAEDVQQECKGCTQEELNAAVAEKQKNILRDLIDQSLLVQRGKDMGVSVETDVIKQLDQVRIQNKLDSMEELEKRVSAEGLNWEDFKNNIRNSILTRKVVSSEVGSHISIGNEEVAKYFEAHKKDFVLPEQVVLREILVSTQGKKESELPDLQKKAESYVKRVREGEEFGEMAKRFSDDKETAKQNGYLGEFQKGALAKELQDAVFKLKKNEITEVIPTKQGYLILQLLEHFDEGEQPLEKVRNRIMDALYGERIEPALRNYLKTLREQSYVVVKPGYVDTAGVTSGQIEEVSATPEQDKSKEGRKKFLLFGKRKTKS